MVKNPVVLLFLLLSIFLNTIIAYKIYKVVIISETYTNELMFDNSEIERVVNSSLNYINYSYKKLQSYYNLSNPVITTDDNGLFESYKKSVLGLENLKSITSNKNLEINLFYKGHLNKINIIFYISIIMLAINMILFIYIFFIQFKKKN